MLCHLCLIQKLLYRTVKSGKPSKDSWIQLQCISSVDACRFSIYILNDRMNNACVDGHNRVRVVVSSVQECTLWSRQLTSFLSERSISLWHKQLKQMSFYLSLISEHIWTMLGGKMHFVKCYRLLLSKLHLNLMLILHILFSECSWVCSKVFPKARKSVMQATGKHRLQLNMMVQTQEWNGFCFVKQ